MHFQAHRFWTLLSDKSVAINISKDTDDIIIFVKIAHQLPPL